MLHINVIGWNFIHPGITINRPNGTGDYDFVLFRCPVWIKEKDTWMQFPKGSFILYDVGTPQIYHSTEVNAVSSNFINDFIHFSGEDLTQDMTDLGFPFDTVCFLPDTNYLSNFIKRIAEEYIRKEIFYQRTIDLMLRTFLLEVAKQLHQTQGEKLALNVAVAESIKNLREQVFQSLSENWTLKRMAETVCLSPSHFHKSYVSLFGISPIQDLIKKRIDTAMYYLGCKELSVKETAVAVGYQNEFYFIRLFKKYTGMSPGQYALYRKSQEVSNVWYEQK